MDLKNIFSRTTSTGSKKAGAKVSAPSEAVQQQPWMEFTAPIIQDVKDLSKIKKELSKDKRASKFASTLLKIYTYFLVALEDKKAAIYYQDKKYRYIGFVNRRDNVFTFIVYPLDDEEVVKNDVNRKVRLSAQNIQTVEEEELKEAVKGLKDNKQMYQLVAVAGLLIVGGGLFMYANRSRPKPPPVVPAPVHPAVQPQVAPTSTTLNPVQQKIALAVAESQCFTKLQKKLDELKKQNVIIKSLTVSASSSPAGAQCSYSIMEDYTVPVVGSKLDGKYYEKTETGNVNIGYGQFISIEPYTKNLFTQANFVKCLEEMKSAQFKLLARPGVYEGEFAVNKSITPEASYSAGNFLLALESVCGFNLNINQFQLSSKSLAGNFTLNWSQSATPSSTPQVATTVSATPQVKTTPAEKSQQSVVPPKPVKVSPVIKVKAG